MAKKILLTITFFLVLALYISSLGPYVSPKTYIIPSILGGLFPVLLILNLLILGFWLIRRSGWFLLPVLGFFLTWSAVNQHIGLHCFSKQEKYTQLQIGTFNLFGLKKVNLNPALKANLDQEMAESALDIICLQESNPFSESQLAEALTHQFDHHYAFAGLQLWSRFPIFDRGTFDLGSNVNGVLWTDLDLGNRSIRVYCVHLRSNMVSSKADELIEGGKITEGKTWSGIRDVMGRYKRAALIRSEQAQEIKQHVSESIHPVIICGDFNDHPLSYTMAVLQEGFSDSFEEKGCGWGTTYGGSLPLLRIDYILTDSTFSVTEHQVHSSKVSDHHLVRCGLAFSE